MGLLMAEGHPTRQNHGAIRGTRHGSAIWDRGRREHSRHNLGVMHRRFRRFGRNPGRHQESGLMHRGSGLRVQGRQVHHFKRGIPGLGIQGKQAVPRAELEGHIEACKTTRPSTTNWSDAAFVVQGTKTGAAGQQGSNRDLWNRCAETEGKQTGETS